MKLWSRKISVILITIMTLGMYVPPSFIDVEAEEGNKALSEENHPKENNDEDKAEAPIISEPEEEATSDRLINRLREKAKEQSITKLGPRIAMQVEEDFTTEILPRIEEALEMILTEADEEQLPYYGITEHPANGVGEKIFNVYDYRTRKDIARFHVRRDNRPLEGYWFNFHYHVSRDGFENHHEIGEIYWDKNIPPRWMS
ncbi:YpjP family protein [Virgibacillus kekensis]|uniref:YpjP family protein n=1 Tax=Virgibacillus kekensis TaxID=202261 RepID=A0ABV9DJ49_9BACI